MSLITVSRLKIFLFLIVLHFSTLIHGRLRVNPYCSLNCGENKHTACLYKPCKIGSSCGAGARGVPLSNEERTLMLAAHNDLRQKLASGGDTRGGNQAASNMRAMSYDVELEFIAQCYSNACQKGHDKCRRTATFEVGQNIYYAGGRDNYDDKSYLQQAVKNWYEEIEQFDSSTIDHYKFSDGTGHFTQVIWAETDLVGCGRTFDKEKSVVIICNYGVAGNFLGNSIYKKGDKCSACSGGLKCNRQYDALCGEHGLKKGFLIPYNILSGGCKMFSKRRNVLLGLIISYLILKYFP